jgi:hypothetical protein
MELSLQWVAPLLLGKEIPEHLMKGSRLGGHDRRVGLDFGHSSFPRRDASQILQGFANLFGFVFYLLLVRFGGQIFGLMDVTPFLGLNSWCVLALVRAFVSLIASEQG